MFVTNQSAGRTSGTDVETIAEILARRARTTPTNTAFRYLVDGDEQEEIWSYSRLDAAARSVASALGANRNPRGERALLLFPPGPDYIAAFFGCLYAGAIPVPAYPPDPTRLGRTLPRLLSIINDSGASYALTTEPIRGMAEVMLADVLKDRTEPLDWIATDTVVSEGHAGRDPHHAEGPDVAFLQYTSGSTTMPRGVMVTHGNLLHNFAEIMKRSGPRESFSAASWLPPYHDMGLIGGILSPIFEGLPVTLMSPLDFLQRPVRWLNALSRYQCTATAAPNFAYDLCVRKVTAAQRAKLDLSSWVVTFNGAEPIDAGAIDRFVEAFGPCGFRRETFLPCYGLAEGTLLVSTIPVDAKPTVRTFSASGIAKGVATHPTQDGDSYRLVGSGFSIDGQRAVIVNPETRERCPDGQVGEIWLQGRSIAAGYWNRADQTEATFKARIDGAENEGEFLRTGDLGVMVDGELFVTGRIKDLIIIAGANHYPQDIERSIESAHPSVRPGSTAAFSVPVEGSERLVVVAECDEPKSPEEAQQIVTALRKAIAEGHQLSAHSIILMKKGAVPRTSSGKIQRHQCRDGFLSGTLEKHEY
jgi:acyl-CoA synthetase (AMP-forming)/AMP-acid ligase II